jgi:pimeloyl-ACP methyl ester carboxylesterase
MRRLRVVVLAVVSAVVLTGAGSLPASSADADGRGVACRAEPFAVQTPAPQTLAGTVCRPSSGRPRAAVLLVHGSTYDSRYWDPPGLDPARYSTLRQLAAAGFQAVAVDRPGSGQSPRPPEVTADASVAALHGVVQRLRHDPAMRTSSGKVFTVGHSSGSSLAILEAAKYDDVDGLVVTGFTHEPADRGDPVFPAILYAASEDARFQGQSMPGGYVTTEPGARIIWHHGYNSDKQVYLLDEAQLKDAMPPGDPGGFIQEVFVGPPRSLQVDVPVLAVLGDRDFTNCTPPACPQLAAEKGYWPNSPEFRGELVRDTAHALALHRDADKTTTDLIRRWLAQHS